MGLERGDFRSRIERIKAKYSVLEYAQGVLGLSVVRGRCVSVSGGHNPTAMVVSNDWWYDFKLGMGGDVIDLCAVARHNGDKGAAIRELGGDLIDGDWVRYTQNLCNKVAKWQTELRDSDWRYLQRRRIKKETVERLKIGYNPETGRLTIPYLKNGYVAYVVTRERDGEGPKYKKEPLDGLNENIPWGLHTLDRLIGKSINDKTPPKNDKGDVVSEGLVVVSPPQTTNHPPQTTSSVSPGSEKTAQTLVTTTDTERVAVLPLIIAEGAFDAISFEQEGYPVLSPMGGHFSREALKQVLSIAKGAQGGAFIIFDSDGPGVRFQTDMAKLFFRHQIKFRCGVLENYKDVSDYYADGGDIGELVAAGRPGLEVLCERIEDKEEFKKFVFEAARFVGKPELAELFDLVKDKFPAAWTAAVKQQASAAPPEDQIVKEIVEKKRLKYHENLGFYEYTMGVWRHRCDTEIKRYVADALGQYRTGTKVASITKLLAAEVVTRELFNQQPVFNFRNCVLELETGEVCEHSEAFMSSIQAEYSYNPNADCPLWRQFIEEVAMEDDARIALLQEIAGYVLFSDNSLQKCFFLIGEGANGKSVYLDILTALYGRDNVSTVEMSGLAEPFQRIHLLTSILNISSETQSNVKGAEAIFKQIVVGDAISGCYKNKDFLTFQPRTKLIAACNEYMKTKDTTTGFLRRVCFVAFQAHFVDFPGPGEKKADKQIKDKLMAELPGIFNWAYAGYKELKRRGSFTQTLDSQDMMRQFIQLSNPVSCFIEEELQEGIISRKDLYEKYTTWCREGGHEPMSRTRFIQNVARTAKQMGWKIDETKYCGERRFIFSQPIQDTSAPQSAPEDLPQSPFSDIPDKIGSDSFKF